MTNIEAMLKNANAETVRIQDELGNMLHKAEARIRELELANESIGKWLSAALDDPSVCDEMKSDIQAWLSVTAFNEV